MATPTTTSTDPAADTLVVKVTATDENPFVFAVPEADGTVAKVALSCDEAQWLIARGWLYRDTGPDRPGSSHDSNASGSLLHVEWDPATVRVTVNGQRQKSRAAAAAIAAGLLSVLREATRTT